MRTNVHCVVVKINNNSEGIKPLFILLSSQSISQHLLPGNDPVVTNDRMMSLWSKVHNVK